MILDIAPERIVAALIKSKGTAPARARGTFWEERRASAEHSGMGKLFDLSLGEFAADLTEGGEEIIPKGKGPCYTLGTSTRGGSTDLECATKDGDVLDLDDPNPEGIRRLTEALTAAGIGWVLQTRNGKKAHLHLFYDASQAIPQPITPEQKREFSRLISFAISLFETLGRASFDHHGAARLLGLVYSYSRTVEMDTVETTYSDGVGIDVAALVQQFPAELAAYAPKAPTPRETDLPPAVAALLGSKGDGLTADQAEIVVAFTALKINLRVESAPRGQRHTQNLRDSLQLVRATLETAARDNLTINRDTLRDAAINWFQPRIDSQAREGFSPDRPPSLDIELAVSSAVDAAFSPGGKVVELAAASKFKAVFERATEKHRDRRNLIRK